MGTSVQNSLSNQLLDQFNVSIGLNLQNKLQDWQGRQDIGYESIKVQLSKEWHSLPDFNFQLALYSTASHTLQIAWGLIKAIVPNNPKIVATLINIPGFGQVGSSVLSLVGISNILVAPQSILQNEQQFTSTISSLS